MNEVAQIVINKHIYLHTRALSGHHSDPCAHSAVEPFFGDFSAARTRLVTRLAPSDSPRSRGPCPHAGPPSPRPSRCASEVARSRLRGLPHAPQSQSCLFTTTSLLGPPYSPAVTLFFFWSQSLVLDRHGLGAAAAATCFCCCPQHQY